MDHDLTGFLAAARAGDMLAVRTRLIATHNERMVRCGTLSPELGAMAWAPLRGINGPYLALLRLGHAFDHHPASFLGGWAEHLQWALDSIGQAVRLMLAGQPLGALLIARSQLERWSENLAHARGETRRQDESLDAYISRLWSTGGGSLGLRAHHPLLFKGQEVDPGVVYRSLSEVAHGQDLESVRWFATDLGGSPNEEALALYSVISSALLLSLMRVELAIPLLAADEESQQGARKILEVRPLAPNYVPIIPMCALAPLNALVFMDPTFFEPVRGAKRLMDRVWAGERPAGRLYNDAEMPTLQFLHLRGRALEWSERAFAQERAVVGFLSEGGLMQVESPAILVSEIAGEASQWTREPIAAAAMATIATALRSAYWLWLEDDNRAMAALRVVLEQSARLRAWRLRPDKATILEQAGTPTRWLERAGWRRLAALNKALGELTHFRPNVKWLAAVDLLVQFNSQASTDEQRVTARRNALETVTRLAAIEIREQCRLLDDDLGQVMNSVLATSGCGGPEVDAELDDYLRRLEAYRGYEFPDESEWELMTESGPDI